MSQFERILARLQRFYGHLAQPPRDPFAYFVWEILSARTTTVRRDRAFAALKRLPALTPDSLTRAAPGRLLEAVSQAGPYAESRVEALRAGAEAFRQSPALRALALQPLAQARRALELLPQIDRVAARRMFLFSLGRGGIPPDPGVMRVGRRLGIAGGTGRPHRDARLVRRALTQLYAGQLEDCRFTFLYLAHHGEVTCTEADPRCGVCPVLEDCPEGRMRVKNAAS